MLMIISKLFVKKKIKFLNVYNNIFGNRVFNSASFTDSLLRKKKDYFVHYSWEVPLTHSFKPCPGVTKTQHSSSNPFGLPISCP